ncbi:MAG: tetratricopeptide repeat protein [Kineothrix sp.]
MVCYNCGRRLSEHDFCTACRADVAVYKKIMSLSNRFYNDGLEKAGVRDLTGAIASLKQSLKFNKNNIEARNLLGLVYYEMGEVVSALSEWVISKNLMSDKNIADGYIRMIQSNQSRLDSINQTIKKYNQALAYCCQGSLDIAVIQLKKVLSLNPRFVRAHQLLALLYIDRKEWEKARRELNKCMKIDANNTATIRYMKEVEKMLTVEEGARVQPRKRETSGDAVTYQSGNEMIIQPIGVKEPKGVPALLNMGIGIVVGLAAAWFLILPARIQSAQAAIDMELRTVSEQSDAKSATITGLEQQIRDLANENAGLQESLDGYVGKDGALQAMDKLLSAANAYLAEEGDVIAVSEFLDEVNVEEMGEAASQAFTALYETLTELVGPELARTYYDQGYAAYRQEKYDEAVSGLEKAYHYDVTNGDALFYLANSYRETNNIEKAREAYVKVIEQFPGTLKASKSQTYLAEINNGN